MPSRRDIFVNGNIYHIFNKTIDSKNIFLYQNIAELFLNLMRYYRSLKADIRYSYFVKLDDEIKERKEREIQIRKYYKVNILAYCLMPNHFHILLKQTHDKGSIRFMADILNSLTRYFNVANQRKGPIFLPQFKSRMIVSREQLIHVSRYIQLNPYSGGIVKSLEELEKYKYSSLREYLFYQKGVCDKEVILGNFIHGVSQYRNFIFNHADYQRSLDRLKYVVKWI